MLAAENGYTEIAASLITAGAPLDSQDALEHTALSLAAEEGYEEIVALLIADGASLGLQDYN